MRNNFQFALSAALLLALSSCGVRQRDVSDEVRGVVMRVDTANHLITLNHEAVPDMIESLIMAYPVDSVKFLHAIKDGDTVLFRLRRLEPGHFSVSSLRELHPPKRQKKK